MRHVGYIVEDPDEVGIFFLAPLASALGKPISNAVKKFKAAKDARKKAAAEAKTQARAVKATASAPATTPADLPAAQSRLSALKSKLSTAIQKEADAKADLLQAKLDERIDQILPSAAESEVPEVPSAPVAASGIVIGNIYRSHRPVRFR